MGEASMDIQVMATLKDPTSKKVKRYNESVNQALTSSFAQIQKQDPLVNEYMQQIPSPSKLFNRFKVMISKNASAASFTTANSRAGSSWQKARGST